jgi:hypothetical protein
LSEKEKWGILGALCLAALLILLWLIESGDATALAIVIAAVATALLGVWGYRAQKKEDHKAALKTKRQGAYEQYIAAFGNANHWKTNVDDWKKRIAVLNREMKDADNDNYDQRVEYYNYAIDKLRDAEDQHKASQAEYHAAHDNLLPAGSDRVIVAVNSFHTYYTDEPKRVPIELKIRYARMIIAMREDSFERTDLTVKGVAQNIPWTIDEEKSRPIDWNRVSEDGKFQ